MKLAVDTLFQLVEHCSQPTLLLDNQGTIRYQNAAADRLLKKRIAGSLDQEVNSWFKRCMTDDVPHQEFKTCQLDESGYSLSLQFRTLPPSDSESFILLEVKDQTDQQRYLSLLEQSRKLDEQSQAQRHTLMASVIHELKTPLNAIFGFTQLCKERNDCDLLDDFLQTIMDSTDKMTRMVNELLAISKRESEAVEVTLERMNLADAITQTLTHLSRIPNIHQCDIQLQHDDISQVEVFADPLRFEQVLSNLLVNGVKYGSSEQITVSVSLTDDRVCVTVADQGPGIDPKRQPSLFEPFTRLGLERSEIEGTGLGLYLSKQLVERMGGEMGYRPAEPQGSEFWFTLTRI
jgi:signal transduction histidine kinase